MIPSNRWLTCVGHAEGQYHMPSYLAHDARTLITGMLHVDPVKRMTITEIMAHPWFTPDLPRYLSPLPPPPGPVLGTLTSLVAPPNVVDFEGIDGLGRIEDDVVDELAQRMEGVDKEEVWECLRRDDGVQGNAVKVAYMLLRDKRRQGQERKYLHRILVSIVKTLILQLLCTKRGNVRLRSWLWM